MSDSRRVKTIIGVVVLAWIVGFAASFRWRLNIAQHIICGNLSAIFSSYIGMAITEMLQ